MKKSLLNFFIFLIILTSCESGTRNYFPFSIGAKWLYSITISSSYTGKEYEVRIIRKIKKFNKLFFIKWCPGEELNHRHSDFQSLALPTELPGHFVLVCITIG